MKNLKEQCKKCLYRIISNTAPCPPPHYHKKKLPTPFAYTFGGHWIIFPDSLFWRSSSKCFYAHKDEIIHSRRDFFMGPLRGQTILHVILRYGTGMEGNYLAVASVFSQNRTKFSISIQIFVYLKGIRKKSSFLSGQGGQSSPSPSHALQRAPEKGIFFFIIIAI